MHAYSIYPIDYDWDMLNTVNETVSRLVENSECDSDQDNPKAYGRLTQFLASWESAKELAKKVGWEGDFRHEPYVLWFPYEGCFHCGFVFKQENNGNTYVISPIELPHLKPIACEYINNN
ncbi:hypothetical protein J0B02_10910 [Enterobacteriaceae bacterium YMB-R22]|uniref:Uncharacterized protein n=1 Tax=Mixta intestinalis TaxID=1615494 RepID=A0A6P1PYC1_9GAMM|nr:MULTISPECIES: hypothetical protein [Enterobacterales]MBV4413324.1 hypothetical protein [Tenebrionicola larvae]QHM70705.1 hypothetical protein C7M51_00983 [Mixta intestinalis]